MTLLESLEDLARAVAAGRFAPRDQLYVPATLPATLGDERWARIEDSLRRLGVGVHTLPGLGGIYVVSFDELRAGVFPPISRGGSRSPDPRYEDRAARD